MKVKMSWKITVGFLLCVGLIVAMAGLTYLRTQELAVQDKRVVHSNEVVSELHAAIVNLGDAEAGLRRLLLTGDDPCLKSGCNGAVEAPEHLQRLYQLTADAPSQQTRVAELDRASQSELARIAEAVDIYRDQGQAAATAVALSGRGQFDHVRQIAASLAQEEDRTLQTTAEKVERKAGRITSFLRLLAASMLLAIGTCFYTIRKEVRGLARVQGELAQSQEKLKQALEREQKLSRCDPLTQVANRRAFFEALEVECRRARRNGWPVSVAYVDVDNFKNLNDSMGHAAGDALLTTVAGTMKRNLRAGSCVARVGGDEFALMIPDVGLREVEMTLHRIRGLLLKEVQSNGWPVTFSIGAVMFNKPVESGEEMIHLADQEMYSVKNRSKNDISVVAVDVTAHRQPSLQIN